MPLLLKRLLNSDGFNKNVIIVFIGTSLINVLNLVYQFIILRFLSASDFAGFNALLSIFTPVSIALGALQLAVAKYIAQFKACKEPSRIKSLLQSVLKSSFILALGIFLIFFFLCPYLMQRMKISSLSAGYILAVLFALSAVVPVFLGALQGLERFNWLMSVSIVSSILKLVLGVFFIRLGFGISGAVGALLLSAAIALILSAFPLRKWISFLHRDKYQGDTKEVMKYVLPVGIATFCYMQLVNMDMVLVRNLFSEESSGVYSLAQVFGKIFLFLPGAISIVMFPRISGLNARNMDTTAIFKRSITLVLTLGLFANLVYNLFPGMIFSFFNLVTGKDFSGAFDLGRLFGVSMTIFAVLQILVSYFLPLKDFRFIKYLCFGVLIQALAIWGYHPDLICVQAIVCINGFIICAVLLLLVRSNPDKAVMK